MPQPQNDPNTASLKPGGPGATCEKCLWWVRHALTVDTSQGNCHRFPPRLITVERSVQSRYPITEEGVDYCGEWMEKKP